MSLRPPMPASQPSAASPSLAPSPLSAAQEERLRRLAATSRWCARFIVVLAVPTVVLEIAHPGKPGGLGLVLTALAIGSLADAFGLGPRWALRLQLLSLVLMVPALLLVFQDI